MATTTTAAIQKIVRKVLDEELDERNEAMLEAIERLGRVLTEEVIPRLPDEADEGDQNDIGDEPPSGSVKARTMRVSDVKPGADEPDDDVGIPEDDNEPNVPSAVAEAFDELYAAIAREPADEAGQADRPPTPQRPPHKPARPRARLAS
jgi:hypothetical protein